MTVVDVIGESCFLFKSGDISLITDPWFGESIYGGAWTQYPTPKVCEAQLKSISHVFISHVHADHCCIASLSKIFKYGNSPQILMLDRGSNNCYLTQKLHGCFGPEIESRIRRLSPYSQEAIGGLTIWGIPSESGNALNDMLDSSLLIDTDDGLVFFANDNVPSREHSSFINGLSKNQLLALIPFSGGSGFPCSYENISDDEKHEIASKIRRDYMDIAISFLGDTDFDFFMPVAGNHIVVNKSTAWHETTGFLLNPFRAISYALANLKGHSKGIYSRPCQDLQLERCAIENDQVDPLARAYDFDKNLFIESLSSRMMPEYTCSSFDNETDDQIDVCIHHYGRVLSDFMRESKCKDGISDDARVMIRIGQYLGSISRHGCNLVEIPIELELCNFVSTLENSLELLLVEIKPALFSQIRKRKIHINEADAAGLLSYWRSMPYSPSLYAKLFETIH